MWFMVNVVVIYITNKILHLNYVIYAIFAFLIAVTSNFILNRNWAFGDNGKRGVFSRMLRVYAF